MQSITVVTPERSKRFFVAEDFDSSAWSNIEPYFKKLNEAEINSVEDLRSWLKNWSELQAIMEEAFRWIYVRTTLDTTDEKAKADLTNFYQNIYPHAAAYANQLENKLIASPYTAQLDKEVFFTTVRKMKKQAEMFRAENMPLLSELNIKQSRFDEITGAQSVDYKGQELTLQQATVYFKSNDRAEREEVFKLTGDRRLQDSEELDTLFTELIKMRH